MLKNSKSALKVFLCYASADRNFTQDLYSRLTKDGVDVWLDEEKLLPGQDWETDIRKAVREADIVIVCHSKQFNQAGRQQKEVRWALDTAMEKPEDGIFIIPARLEECDTLESLRRWQPVNLFDEQGYDLLMRALRARAEKIGGVLKPRKSVMPITRDPSINEDLRREMDKGRVGKRDRLESAPKPVPQYSLKTIIEILAAVATILVAIFGLPWNKWVALATDVPTATATNTYVIATETFTPRIESPKIMTFTVLIKGVGQSVQPGSSISVQQNSALAITANTSGSVSETVFRWSASCGKDNVAQYDTPYILIISDQTCVISLVIETNSGTFLTQARFTVTAQ